MSRRILVLGATGMLGEPVTRSLAEGGHPVRILVRSAERARALFGNTVEIAQGSALNRGDVQAALTDCGAVHINLTQESELTAAQHVVERAPSGLERITYVSATTASEEHRWFPVIDVKLRTEAVLGDSGIPYTVFCPTWVMETLNNFVRGKSVAVIVGKNPPPLHFVAAADFARMVAASYEDDRAVGKRLFVHGPDGVTLPDALERFAAACHPDLEVRRVKLWQAKLLAKLTGREGLTYVTRLISYFDKVGESGDPSEANALFGAPRTTLDEWFALPSHGRRGLPH